MLEGTDLDTHLDNATYRGKDVFMAVGDNANVHVVIARKVIQTRRE